MKSEIESRSFAIADIHGCNRTFRQLLFERIKLVRSDTLYLLGDYIDRGPDSKGVLDIIMELQREHYDVRPIFANHEDLLLQAIRTGEDQDLWDWLDNGGRETLKSFKVDHPEDIPERYLDFIGTLPLYLTTDTHIFVHAGLNLHLENPFSKEGRNSMLWERQVKVEPEKIGGRKLVTGHTIIGIDDIVKSLNSNLIQLDNGCFLGSQFEGSGNLVALELNKGELHVQENIE